MDGTAIFQLFHEVHIPIFFLCVSDDLRVPAADVEDGGVVGPGDEPTHLDVADAVVHPFKKKYLYIPNP